MEKHGISKRKNFYNNAPSEYKSFEFIGSSGLPQLKESNGNRGNNGEDGLNGNVGVYGGVNTPIVRITIPSIGNDLDFSKPHDMKKYLITKLFSLLL